MGRLARVVYALDTAKVGGRCSGGRPALRRPCAGLAQPLRGVMCAWLMRSTSPKVGTASDSESQRWAGLLATTPAGLQLRAAPALLPEPLGCCGLPRRPALCTHQAFPCSPHLPLRRPSLTCPPAAVCLLRRTAHSSDLRPAPPSSPAQALSYLHSRKVAHLDLKSGWVGCGGCALSRPPCGNAAAAAAAAAAAGLARAPLAAPGAAAGRLLL